MQSVFPKFLQYKKEFSEWETFFSRLSNPEIFRFSFKGKGPTMAHGKRRSNDSIGSWWNKRQRFAISGTTFVKLLFQPERPADMDLGLVEYTGAIKWAEWDANRRPTLGFYEFNFDLNRIEFEHHWLFTIEDKLARKIKTYHHELTAAGMKAMNLLETYLMEKMTAEVRILSEDQLAKIHQNLGHLEAEFAKHAAMYGNLSARLKQAWRELVEERKKLKTCSTTLVLKEAKLPDTVDVEYLPEEIRRFTQLPVFILENVENKDAPVNVQKTLSRIRIQILIFFNDTLVCRTPSTKLNPDFSVEFRKVYQLRIYEPPEKIMLLMRELQPVKEWVEISRVYIPFPDDNNNLDEIEFGSDITVEKLDLCFYSSFIH